MVSKPYIYRKRYVNNRFEHKYFWIAVVNNHDVPCNTWQDAVDYVTIFKPATPFVKFIEAYEKYCAYPSDNGWRPAQGN